VAPTTGALMLMGESLAIIMGRDMGKDIPVTPQVKMATVIMIVHGLGIHLVPVRATLLELLVDTAASLNMDMLTRRATQARPKTSRPEDLMEELGSSRRKMMHSHLARFSRFRDATSTRRHPIKR